MAFTTKSLYSSVQVYEAAGDSLVHEEGDNPSAVWKFVIRGASEAAAAYSALLSYLNIKFGDDSGALTSYDLPLRSVKLTATDSSYIYEAEVSFSFPQVENDQNINDEEYEQPTISDLDFSYSTVGGSAHLTHSIKTLAAVKVDGSTATDYGRGIGWNGDAFDGIDVVAPKSEISIAVNWPRAFFNSDYRKTLANATACINSKAWNGYEAGCVLFKGVQAQPQKFDYTDASGNNVRDYYWRATYQFECSPSIQFEIKEDGDEEKKTTIATGSGVETVDPLQPDASTSDETTAEPVVVTKRGFDAIWRTSERKEDADGKLSNGVAQINVEQVYREFDFDLLGLPFPE